MFAQTRKISVFWAFWVPKIGKNMEKNYILSKRGRHVWEVYGRIPISSRRLIQAHHTHTILTILHYCRILLADTIGRRGTIFGAKIRLWEEKYSATMIWGKFSAPKYGRRMGGVWEAYGRRMGGVWEAYGRRMGGVWEAYGRRMGGVWEAYGRRMGGVWAYGRMGGVWEAYGRRMGGVWEVYGRRMGGVWEAYGRRMGNPNLGRKKKI